MAEIAETDVLRLLQLALSAADTDEDKALCRAVADALGPIKISVLGFGNGITPRQYADRAIEFLEQSSQPNGSRPRAQR